MTAVALAAVLAGATVVVVAAARPAPQHARQHAHRRSARRDRSPHGAARGQGQHARAGLLGAAAGYLGATPAQLRQQLVAGKSLAQIAAATPGKSATGLVEALVAAARAHAHDGKSTAKLQQRFTAAVYKVRRHVLVHAAAGYLGLAPAQLHGELRSGRSLAQIASATPGKSAAALVQALTAARRAELAGKVRAGAITQARASQLAPRLASRIEARVRRQRFTLRMPASS